MRYSSKRRDHYRAAKPSPAQHQNSSKGTGTSVPATNTSVTSFGDQLQRYPRWTPISVDNNKLHDANAKKIFGGSKPLFGRRGKCAKVQMTASSGFETAVTGKHDDLAQVKCSVDLFDVALFHQRRCAARKISP